MPIIIYIYEYSLSFANTLDSCRIKVCSKNSSKENIFLRMR